MGKGLPGAVVLNKRKGKRIKKEVRGDEEKGREGRERKGSDGEGRREKPSLLQEHPNPMCAQSVSGG